MTTYGKVHYRQSGLRLWHDPDDRFQRQGTGRFRVSLLTAGAGIIERPAGRELFEAPAVLLCDERDLARLAGQNEWRARSLYFHPGIINDRLDFDNLRQPGGALSATDLQDRYLLRCFLAPDAAGWSVLKPPLPVFQRLTALFEEIAAELEAQSDNCWTCRCRMLVIQVLGLLGQNEAWQRTMSVSGSDRLVEDLLMYLHAHYHQAIGLAHLTREFAINRTSLNERFKAVTGTTVMDYVQKLRLETAMTMLRDSMAPVGEIMERVGFNDPTHFGRMFRRAAGLSPSDYREQMCWMLKPHPDPGGTATKVS